MLLSSVQTLICGQDLRQLAYLAWIALREGAGAAQRAMRLAYRRAVERRELDALDGRMQRDAGLGPPEVQALLRKPLWRA
ncbi:hypothetical protein [Belnapia arida]|nr:hypothetical protein [Belnapia arida]